MSPTNYIPVVVDIQFVNFKSKFLVLFSVFAENTFMMLIYCRHESHISLKTKSPQVRDMKSSLISFINHVWFLMNYYSIKLQEPLIRIHFVSAADEMLILFSQYCFQFADGDFSSCIKLFVKPTAVMCDYKTCSKNIMCITLFNVKNYSQSLFYSDISRIYSN